MEDMLFLMAVLFFSIGLCSGLLFGGVLLLEVPPRPVSVTYRFFAAVAFLFSGGLGAVALLCTGALAAQVWRHLWPAIVRSFGA